jgi:hypothetical protein
MDGLMDGVFAIAGLLALIAVIFLPTIVYAIRFGDEEPAGIGWIIS